MNKHLHIVSFDVPYPPSYGGVIEVYFKIKSLHEAGVKVHLHCFEYGRQRQKELEKICESVSYYPRKTISAFLFSKLPYIVLSRSSEELKKNLLKDEHPILMEGLHSTFYLNDKNFANRKIIVRTHNIEHTYYENLAKVEQNIFKKYYFKNEASKLKKYEAILKNASCIAAISENDESYYSSEFPNVKYTPAFHPHHKTEIKEGKGNFAFYHGNLAVGENNQAALFLVNEVFNDLEIPFIIAGSKPSKELIRATRSKPHIELKADISTENIYSLIKEAQINVLPTFQATGIKLKLLAVLFSGRHCIVNTPMIENTGLESLCSIADTAIEMKEKIKNVFEKEFDKNEVVRREKILIEKFSNQTNVEKLIQLIF